MLVLVKSSQVINIICIERKEMDECEDREAKKNPNPAVVSSSTSLQLNYQGFGGPSSLKFKK